MVHLNWCEHESAVAPTALTEQFLNPHTYSLMYIDNWRNFRSIIFLISQTKGSWIWKSKIATDSKYGVCGSCSSFCHLNNISSFHTWILWFLKPHSDTLLKGEMLPLRCSFYLVTSNCFVDVSLSLVELSKELVCFRIPLLDLEIVWHMPRKSMKDRNYKQYSDTQALGQNNGEAHMLTFLQDHIPLLQSTI